MSIAKTESYDLNSIFQMNINYNFDLLKTILEGILKKEKDTVASIADLHLIIKEKDSQITKYHFSFANTLFNSLEQNISSLSSQFQEKIASISQLTSQKMPFSYGKDEKSPTVTEEAEDNTKTPEIKGIEDNITLAIGVNSDDLTNKLIRKINSIEYTVNSFARVLTEVSKYKTPIEEHKVIFRQHNRMLTDIHSRLTSLEKVSDQQVKQLQELEIKTEDLNLMETVQKANLIGSGDSSITFGLLSNLERKINQKMKFVDERAAKQDEETIKLRNSLTSLTNSNDKTLLTMTSVQEYCTKQFSVASTKLSLLQTEFNSFSEKAFADMKKIVNDKASDTTAAFESKLNELSRRIISSIPVAKPVEDSVTINTQLIDVSKSIKDLNKKANDLEKASKMVPITVEALWKELNAAKDGLNQKVSIYEHQELKDSLSEYNREASCLKDKLETLLEDESRHEEIKAIKKKMESMNNAIYALKVAEQEITAHGAHGKMQIDTTKLLEVTAFNEFKAGVIKEYECLNENLNQFKRILDEVTSTMKTKSSFKDLKALEDELIEKMEDLRAACSKKFSDKCETSKALKYLEQQIKHIVDVYIKKMDRGDSWLLAKKPLGGHTCGSCENYLGDLKDNPHFIAWNKYPVRDPNDKLYRIGNGFSKMLQMVTVDSPSNEKKDNNFQTSREFFNSSHNDFSDLRDHSAPKHKNLPRIVKNPKLNLSNEEVLDNFSDAKESIDPNHPKITKIVKKGKKGD